MRQRQVFLLCFLCFLQASSTQHNSFSRAGRFFSLAVSGRIQRGQQQRSRKKEAFGETGQGPRGCKVGGSVRANCPGGCQSRPSDGQRSLSHGRSGLARVGGRSEVRGWRGEKREEEIKRGRRERPFPALCKIPPSERRATIVGLGTVARPRIGWDGGGKQRPGGIRTVLYMYRRHKYRARGRCGWRGPVVAVQHPPAANRRCPTVAGAAEDTGGPARTKPVAPWEWSGQAQHYAARPTAAFFTAKREFGR